MTVKKTVKVTKAAEPVTKPATKKVAAKVVMKTPAKKAVPAKKVAKPMKTATVTLGNQGKKKVDQTPKAETKIAELRAGISTLYGH